MTISRTHSYPRFHHAPPIASFWVDCGSCLSLVCGVAWPSPPPPGGVVPSPPLEVHDFSLYAYFYLVLLARSHYASHNKSRIVNSAAAYAIFLGFPYYPFRNIGWRQSVWWRPTRIITTRGCTIYTYTLITISQYIPSRVTRNIIYIYFA